MTITNAIVRVRPVEAGVPTRGNRAFGVRRTPTHRHQGVDLVSARGAPVRAVLPGAVTHASSKLARGFSGYGRHVVVRASSKGQAGPASQAEQGGPWFLYAHLDTVKVRPGDTVKAGQVLGTVGNSCFSAQDPGRLCGGKAGAGYHLHFEVSPSPYPQPSEAPRIDPVLYLTEGTLSTPVQMGLRAGPGVGGAVFAPVLLGGLWWLLGRVSKRRAGAGIGAGRGVGIGTGTVLGRGRA